MTQNELAFRNIARNDCEADTVRSVPQLVALLKRKHVTKPLEALTLLRAYDDERRAYEAQEAQICRHCKSAPPMHWHSENIVQVGRWIQRWKFCTDNGCATPPVHIGAVCHACCQEFSHAQLERRNARTLRLLARGANVPRHWIVYLGRAA